MEGGVRVFEFSECVVCRDDHATPTRTLEPCGHKCICNACISVLFRQNKNMWLCPICRGKIGDIPEQTIIYDFITLGFIIYITFMMILYFLWIVEIDFFNSLNIIVVLSYASLYIKYILVVND